MELDLRGGRTLSSHDFERVVRSRGTNLFHQVFTFKSDFSTNILCYLQVVRVNDEQMGVTIKLAVGHGMKKG
jgi:hypothetical protein